MSLERRLVAAVLLVLVASLCLAAALTWQLTNAHVRTEMAAALTVGKRTADSVLLAGAEDDDPRGRLMRLVRSFDGDRHLRAELVGADGKILMQSALEPPRHPAPGFLLAIAHDKHRVAVLGLPPDLAAFGSLRLVTDARNEVAESWAATGLALETLGLFFVLVLGLIVWIMRGAQRPLQELSAALHRIGAGDYAARVNWARRPELAPVQSGFNRMATQLATMTETNRALQSKIEKAQEDERAALSRDLHDEVAPFLFAVSADAALIRQMAQREAMTELQERAESMQGAVAHMQRHLRDILSRLMADATLDRGLAASIEALVDFWRARKPLIDFHVSVAAIDLPQAERVAAFRIVQESLSNAIRHGNPTAIAIMVRSTSSGVDITVADNGSGFSEPVTKGFGLRGMRDRATALGGALSVHNQADGGVMVHAAFGVAPQA